MATLHADAKGTILQFKRTPVEESRYLPPPDTAFTLEFDGHTNAELIQSLHDGLDHYTLVDTALSREGEVLTIAPPCQSCLDTPQLPALLVKLTGDSSLTAGELRTVLRVLLRERGD